MSTNTCIIAMIGVVLLLAAAVIQPGQDYLDHRRTRRILRRDGFFDPDPGDRRAT